jgi:gas vesicle protein
MARTRKNRGTSTNGFLLAGVLAGALIGAAVGAIYTPFSGEEARRLVADWVADRATVIRAKLTAG